MRPAQHLYAIAIGSNRRHGRHGAPAGVARAALAALEGAGLRIATRGPIIATPAVGPAGRGFANSAAIVVSDLAPPAFLALLKTIERRFGRRLGRRWGPRVLDLDILLWNGGAWPPPPRRAVAGRLAVPHALLPARRFALDPLLPIAAGWRHPLGRRTVRQMHAALSRPRPLRRG